MKWLKTYLVLSSIALLLMGCQPQYKKQTSFTDPLSLSGKACVANCRQDKAYCEKRSSQTIEGCKEAAHHKAVLDYQQYQTHYDQSDRPEKTVDDFYDDSACQLAVPCASAYNQCFIHCGGSIHQVDVCVKNCPKVTTSTKSDHT